MKRSPILGCLLTLAFALVPASASAPMQQKPHEGPPRPKPKFLLSDFAWMAGRWTSTIDKNIADVTYMGPDPGNISGVLVIHREDRIYMVELSSLVQTMDGVTLYIRHFSSELQAWEKVDPIVLKLVSYDGKTAEFDNPVNNDPKRSLITRNPDGSFTAHSDVYDDNGQHQAIELTYTRVK
jgi:hypothetical protein